MTLLPVCCIYHKPKAVDESSDESSSDDSSSSSDSDSDSGADDKKRSGDIASDCRRTDHVAAEQAPASKA